MDKSYRLALKFGASRCLRHCKKLVSGSSRQGTNASEGCHGCGGGGGGSDDACSMHPKGEEKTKQAVDFQFQGAHHIAVSGPRSATGQPLANPPVLGSSDGAAAGATLSGEAGTAADARTTRVGATEAPRQKRAPLKPAAR